jgi:hypothetical protein
MQVADTPPAGLVAPSMRSARRHAPIRSERRADEEGEERKPSALPRRPPHPGASPPRGSCAQTHVAAHSLRRTHRAPSSVPWQGEGERCPLQATQARARAHPGTGPLQLAPRRLCCPHPPQPGAHVAVGMHFALILLKDLVDVVPASRSRMGWYLRHKGFT